MEKRWLLILTYILGFSFGGCAQRLQGSFLSKRQPSILLQQATLFQFSGTNFTYFTSGWEGPEYGKGTFALSGDTLLTLRFGKWDKIEPRITLITCPASDTKIGCCFKIFDAITHEPLPGVVIARGRDAGDPRNYVISDKDGQAALPFALNKEDIITLSYVGYEPFQIQPASQTSQGFQVDMARREPDIAAGTEYRFIVRRIQPHLLTLYERSTNRYYQRLSNEKANKKAKKIAGQP